MVNLYVPGPLPWRPRIGDMYVPCRVCPVHGGLSRHIGGRHNSRPVRLLRRRRPGQLIDHPALGPGRNRLPDRVLCRFCRSLLHTPHSVPGDVRRPDRYNPACRRRHLSTLLLPRPAQLRTSRRPRTESPGCRKRRSSPAMVVKSPRRPGFRSSD